MAENKKPVLLDKRIINRMVQTQKISRKDVEKHLSELPDLSEKMEDISSKVYGDKKNYST